MARRHEPSPDPKAQEWTAARGSGTIDADHDGEPAVVSMNDILARREDIRRVAARHGASNPRLFGSVLRGQQGPGSDVDLLVHLDDDRSLLDQIALMHELEDLLGCKVDVVEDEAVYPGLPERILSEAVDL